MLRGPWMEMSPMPRSLTTTLALLLGMACAAAGRAQSPDTHSALRGAPCSACHTCTKPTVTNPCLRGCPRMSGPSTTGDLSQKTGPVVVMLDELEDLYQPVPFDHRGHAHMSEMTNGCMVCHHHSAEGAAHPACKTCHEVSPAPGEERDIRKPTLKAAYHRQCMGCHREWSHGTACGICHPPKAKRGESAGASEPPTPKEILSQMPPPIPEPDVEIYKLESKPAVGMRVIFRHADHIHRFGFTCVECHNEESCSRCHETGRKHEQRIRTLAEHHMICADCHDVDDGHKCRRCHWKEGESRPAPFKHTDVGWPLSRHHKNIGCRLCHKSGNRFTKLNRDCNACHADWSPATFNHAVTGQMLDENHADIDCADCHGDKYDRAPTCSECHDEEEGIVFPKKRPGPVVVRDLSSG